MKPNYLIFILGCLLSFTFFSCSTFDETCRGDYVQIDHTGINIDATDTITSTKDRYVHTVVIKPISTTTEVDVNKGKKCRSQTLEAGILVGDVIDSNSLIITCDKSFSWYNKRTIQAGENLLNVDIFKEDHFNYWHEIDGSRTIFIDADTVVKGLFTFYAEATTKQGNQYKDTVSVYYN